MQVDIQDKVGPPKSAEPSFLIDVTMQYPNSCGVETNAHTEDMSISVSHVEVSPFYLIESADKSMYYPPRAIPSGSELHSFKFGRISQHESEVKELSEAEAPPESLLANEIVTKRENWLHKLLRGASKLGRNRRDKQRHQ